MFWVLICTVHMTVCSCHVTYAFRSESTLYSCLSVKELLAQSRIKIWGWSDWTVWPNGWVFVYELSRSGFDFAPALGKVFLDIQATKECGFTMKHVRDMTRTFSQLYIIRLNIYMTGLKWLMKQRVFKSYRKKQEDCNTYTFSQIDRECTLLVITNLPVASC